MDKRVNLQSSFLKSNVGIYISPCNHSESALFPDYLSPVEWNSCHDAYEYTWMTDPDQYLTGVSLSNKIKLAKSMGFCPHMRCQLGNLTNANAQGDCPAGLCYTKLENGGLSFGACCFQHGVFNSGEMIGYHNKTQRTAKPIYKKNRVILHDTVGGLDESYHNFINANEIYPGVIATQCPMRQTAEDVVAMVLQQNVSLWIQLTSLTQITRLGRELGTALGSELRLDLGLGLRSKQEKEKEKDSEKDCYLLSDLLYNLSHSSQPQHHSIGCLGNTSLPALLRNLTHPAFEAEQFVLRQADHQEQQLDFVWYRDWHDFQIPSPQHAHDLAQIVAQASRVLAEGGSVAVNCLSGRGRTGSLAAVLLGEHLQLRTEEGLVQLIVNLRESRDGLVETPLQYRYVRETVLGLTGTSISNTIGNRSSNGNGVTEISVVLVMVLLVVMVMVLGRVGYRFLTGSNTNAITSKPPPQSPQYQYEPL